MRVRERQMRPRGGFTLIETMLVVAVMGIVLGLAIPNAMRFFNGQRLRGARTELMADMAYARSLAIARRQTVRMVITTDRYQIVTLPDSTVVRSRTAPNGVEFNANVSPRFYPYGLADPAAVVVRAGFDDTTVNLLPNGTATHD